MSHTTEQQRPVVALSDFALANPSIPERLTAVLSESQDAEQSVEFRLGLLQGALAIALPEMLKTNDQDQPHA